MREVKRLKRAGRYVGRRKVRKYPRRKVRRTGSQVGRTLGFPKMLKFKHKYVQQVSLTGSTSSQLFSCNSLYDPDATGAGHQPMYFDQLSALYDHYTVIGSRIIYRIVPAGTSVQHPYRVIVWINDDTTTTGSSTDIAENKFAKTRICTGGINPSQIVLTNRWSAKKFFGPPLANDELKGTPSSNPTEQSYYQINVRSLDGVNSVDLYAHVEIEYIAIWRELKELAGS